MRSYEAARTYFSILGFCAWTVIIIGVLVGLISAGSISQYAGAGAGFLAMMPGFYIMVVGFLLLVFVQIGRASVDTAEYTQQMLKISRDQLEVSKQSLKQGDTFQKNYASLNMETQDIPSNHGYSKNSSKPQKTKKYNPEPAKQIEQEIQYEGRTIKQEDGGYTFGNLSFSSLASAQTYIDQLGVNPKIRYEKP